MNQYLKIALEEIYEDITGSKPSLDIGNLTESDLSQLAIDHHEAHRAAEQASHAFLQTANGTDTLVQLSEILVNDQELSVESIALVKETVKRAVKESRINVSNEGAVLAFFIVVMIASFVAYIMAVINVQRKRKAQAEALNKAFEDLHKEYTQADWSKAWEEAFSKGTHNDPNWRNTNSDNGETRQDGSNISLVLKNIPKWKEHKPSNLNLNFNTTEDTQKILKFLQERHDALIIDTHINNIKKASADTLHFAKEVQGKDKDFSDDLSILKLNSGLTSSSIKHGTVDQDTKGHILIMMSLEKDDNITTVPFNKRIIISNHDWEIAEVSIKPIQSVLLKISNMENSVVNVANKNIKIMEEVQKDFEEIKKISENIPTKALSGIKEIESRIKKLLQDEHAKMDAYTKATTMTLQIFNIYRSFLKEIQTAVKA